MAEFEQKASLPEEYRCNDWTYSWQTTSGFSKRGNSLSDLELAMSQRGFIRAFKELSLDEVVIDIDAHDEEGSGWESLERLEAELGFNLAEYCTHVVDSPRNGRHFYFRKNPDLALPKNIKRFPGVDFLTSRQGKMPTLVGLPGSLHPESDKHYECVSGFGYTLTDCPDALIELLTRKEPASTTTSTPITYDPSSTAITRASKYVAQMPPSISGSGGHDAAFKVALCLVKGFALSFDQARTIFVSEYNPRCEPPWTGKEIEHKLKSAAESNLAAGYLLNEAMPAKSKVDFSRVVHQGECPQGGEIQDEPEQEKQHATRIDPAVEAMRMLESHRIAGFNRLVFWSGGFFYWKAGRFAPIPNSEARALVANSLDDNFTHVGCSDVSDVLEHVRAKSVLSVSIQSPSWLRESTWDVEDIITTKNKVIHLPTFITDPSASSIPATPALFSTVALDYEFDVTPPPTPNWLRFLDQLWPNDQQSIELLQEWFGYCLTPDTRQQKMLMLIGPKRSGKGTICRVLQSVVGDSNVAGPTLSSIQTNFGLWPLLGKSVAIVSDARLSGRADQAIITERLLSITGEDAQTVDRKNLEPVTTKLQTRFMIVSNELPRLQDSSGAFVGRMLVLRLVESFYGCEDKDLSQRLMEERAGILHWAIAGWARLRSRVSFVQPVSGTELLDQMNELSSPILSFVEDRCEVGDQHSVAVQELYQTYSNWCKEMRLEPVNVQTFGRDLAALLPRLRRRQPRVGSRRERFYDGIRLRG